MLGCGCPLPTTARLSRRAALQLQAVRATLATTLPEAAGPERQRRPVGYALLRERRARLLQAAHAALVRERTRGDAAAVGWREAYDAQRAKEPKPSGGKLVHWALESLGRHAVAELCTNYSTWFHTRSHLVRVNSGSQEADAAAAARPRRRRARRRPPPPSPSALAARTPDAATTDADFSPLPPRRRRRRPTPRRRRRRWRRHGRRRSRSLCRRGRPRARSPRDRPKARAAKGQPTAPRTRFGRCFGLHSCGAS